MKSSLRLLLVLAATGGVLLPAARAATAEVGAPAPDFTLTDISGATHRLLDYRGKIVILEWVNPDCPIVHKHYNLSGNIPRLQAKYTAEGVIWLSINSAAPGNEGDYPAAAVRGWMQLVHWAGTDYLRDPTGAVGHLYGAKTTPHIFIINQDGTLVYAGGIDSIPSADPADIAQATNYVDATMADLDAGRPVAVSHSRPYGCSVKY
ncbi:MAG TPA: redoxin domain-containing protein [Opitutaceae bacterium]|nr:redoxin domain-containing protein [Opitutaceae bacterium]